MPAWPQTATARLTNHPLSNREFLEVPLCANRVKDIYRIGVHCYRFMVGAALQFAALGIVYLSVGRHRRFAYIAASRASRDSA